MAETSAAALRRGNKLLKEKKFQEAQSCFEAIIRREPLNGKARLGRMLAVYQLEKLDELLEKEKDFVCSEPFVSAVRFMDAGTEKALSAFVEKISALPDISYKPAHPEAAEGARDNAHLRGIREQIAPGQHRICAKGYLVAGVQSDGSVRITDTVNGQKKPDVSAWRNIVSVTFGEDHIVGLCGDGTVVAAGGNEFGQLNVGAWREVIAVAAGEGFTLGLQADGTVVGTGENSFRQLDICNWNDIAAIAAGKRFAAAVCRDGTMRLCGQLSNGVERAATWQGIAAVECGASYVIGLKVDGTVEAAGTDKYGQTLIQFWKDIVKITTGETDTVGIRRDGRAICIDNDNELESVINERSGTLGEYIEIAVGNGDVFGLCEDGRVEQIGARFQPNGMKEWKLLPVRVRGNVAPDAASRQRMEPRPAAIPQTEPLPTPKDGAYVRRRRGDRYVVPDAAPPQRLEPRPAAVPQTGTSPTPKDGTYVRRRRSDRYNGGER